jgi:hypothetical protein
MFGGKKGQLKISEIRYFNARKLAHGTTKKPAVSGWFLYPT